MKQHTLKTTNAICVILAGGQSRRMGRDKAALPWAGGTLLEHLIETYRPALPVYVSVGEPGRFPHPGAGELVDLRPGMGPLAGLEAAFVQTEAEVVFLTATDLPFGTLALAGTLLAGLGDGDICAIRRRDGGLEPAFAVYRRSCLPVIQTLLDRGRRAFRGLLEAEGLRVNWLEEGELPGFRLDQLLRNVNTPADYDAILGEDGGTV